MSPGPNVILVLSDDQGSRDAGCYGAGDLVTPVMDRLAAEGVRFTDFYATAPVCMPSRASLLTGRYSPRSLLPGQGLRPGEITAAELFRRAGYRTALFGKWHLGETPAMSPQAHGFEHFVGHTTGTIDAYSHFYYWGGANRLALQRDTEPLRVPGRYLPDLLVEEATGFIRGSAGRPFFLYLPFAIPHYPLQPRRAHRELFEGKGLQDERRILYGAYLATLDECVGRVLDCVEEEGLTERTLVLFLSDNGHSVEERAFDGGGSAGPFRGHKYTLWEGGIRVPCLARWPGRIAPGQVREQPAAAIDWLPTMAQYCGLQLPADRPIDGHSLVSVIDSAAAPPPHERLHWVHYDGSLAVREGRWKLHSTAEFTWLSDLASDPGERIDRSAGEAQRVARMVAEHNRWVVEVTRGSPQLLRGGRRASSAGADPLTGEGTGEE